MEVARGGITVCSPGRRPGKTAPFGPAALKRKREGVGAGRGRSEEKSLVGGAEPGAGRDQVIYTAAVSKSKR